MKNKFGQFRNDYLNEKYKPFKFTDIFMTYGHKTEEGKRLIEIETHINFAIKEGYLTYTDAENMTWKDKEEYFAESEDANLRDYRDEE